VNLRCCTLALFESSWKKILVALVGSSSSGLVVFSTGSLA
jgi:hypothetical protein